MHSLEHLFGDSAQLPIMFMPYHNHPNFCIDEEMDSWQNNNSVSVNGAL